MQGQLLHLPLGQHDSVHYAEDPGPGQSLGLGEGGNGDNIKKHNEI